MIDIIKLINFKCFSELSLELGSLTLLCGLNGSGKSSVIQSLLVLNQSYRSQELLHGRLVLGADLADLGTGVDVLFEDAKEDLIGFEISGHSITQPWELKFDYARTSDQLIAQPRRNHRPPSYVPMPWRRVPPFGGNIIYVSAERLGPRKLHIRSETAARRWDLGIRGEHAFNFINERQSELLPEGDLRCMNSKSPRLVDVLDVWLQEVTPGAHLGLETIANADALIAGFSFDRTGDIESRRYRATNVGFGLSYTLPVILALLAPKGSLVLLENPEAHLHPRGQTKIAELAVRAALGGVQVLVETHSDHFMDGVRIAVRDNLIEPKNVCFHYFERRDGVSVVTSPQIDQDGRLSTWPEGFFDQHEENLARLLAPKPDA